jgi:hypothetical protein
MVRGWPLWRKAPFGLFRHPGLLAAAIIGALLLTLVAAAYPLFLSRSEGALLRARIADPIITSYSAGMFYGVTNVRLMEKVPGDDELLRDRLDDEFTQLASRGPHLSRPVLYAAGAAVLVTLPGGIQPETGPVDGRLFAGTGAARNVEVLEGSEDEGALVPDLIADALGVGPGDIIELEGDAGKVKLRVGGVYRSLYTQPRRGFWLPWSEQIFRECFGCPTPPQFILVDRQELMDLTRAVGEHEVDLGWVAPVSGLPLTIDEARDVASYTDSVLREATDRRTEVGRLLACCGTTFEHPLVFRRDTEFRSAIPLVIREVERRAAAVEGPLRLVLIAALGVALAMVAAAAVFAVAGRRAEAAFLNARGWGPVGFAARSTLEAVIPTLIGVVVGLSLGWWLIALFGPGAPAAFSARQASLMGAAAAGTAALVVCGIASGATFIRTFEVHHFRSRLAWVPWEVFAIVGALWVLSRLRSGGALVEDPRLDIQRPSALLLAFPVLFVAGFATFGARLLLEGLRRSGSKLGSRSSAAYLAAHRLTGLPRLTVLLVGAAGLCLGVFVNAQTMVRSVRETVDAKAKVFVGSDVSVLIDYSAPEQTRFPLPITRSTRLTNAGHLLPSEIPFDMLGIDAATIADVAYWDPSFADEPFADLVARLHSREGPLPVVLVQGGGDPAAVDTAQVELPIEVVGRADAFPGVSSEDPVVVVDVASLNHRLGNKASPLRSTNARTEFWIAGDPDRGLDAVSQLEAFPLNILTAEEVKDVPFIAAAIDTFAMLSVLGLAAALLMIGVLMVYLQARQRARTVSTVFSLRMGMRDRQAMWAIVLELAAMLLAAFALGSLLGVAAGGLVAPLLDPLQSIPPAPLFVVPSLIVAWTLGALAVTSLVGGWFVHRRAANVDLGHVLRVAE